MLGDSERLCHGLALAPRAVMRGERVVVEFERLSNERQRRDLAAFAGHCVTRVERQLGTFQCWKILVGLFGRQARASFTVGEGDGAIISHGSSLDPALAIWDATCRIEQRLRENLAANGAR